MKDPKDIKVAVVTKEFALLDRFFIALLVKSAIEDSTRRATVNFDENVFPELLTIELGREIGVKVSAPAPEPNASEAELKEIKEAVRVISKKIGINSAKDMLDRFGAGSDIKHLTRSQYHNLMAVKGYINEAFTCGSLSCE